MKQFDEQVELAIVRSDNTLGLQSWGWPSLMKIILNFDRSYEDEEAQVLAKRIATALNQP